MVVRRQIETDTSPSPNDKTQEIITLNDYKNESGFYAIPKEKWQLLSEDDRAFVKKYNNKLRKDFENDRSNNKRTIHARRSSIEDKDEGEPLPANKYSRL